MRASLSSLALVVATFASCPAALAGEEAIQLKPGAGVETVQQNCVACHSLDYIQMNSPFLDEKGWTAVVTKMAKAFSAPIEASDQKKIAEYLTANYGKP